MSQKKIITPLSASMPSVVSRFSRRQGRTTQKKRQIRAASGTAIWRTVNRTSWKLERSSGPVGVSFKFGPVSHLVRTKNSKAIRATPAPAQ